MDRKFVTPLGMYIPLARAARRASKALAALTAALLVAVPMSACHGEIVVAPTSGPVLDLSGYKLTFEDAFSTMSISGSPGSGERWFAHTPWFGDFGDARFENPGPNGPFSLTPEGLQITARKGEDGKWTSGLISSVDKDGPTGRGFSQKYGYFEMKARMPDGDGVWPAFWLIGTEKGKTAAEIDVIEFYGRFPEYYHSVTHIWRPGATSSFTDIIVKVDKGSLSSAYNLYGISIDQDTTTFYLNRRPYKSIPTPPEYRQPFYILANLALGSGWPIDKLTSPQHMDIAYIRAYQKTAP